MKTKFFFGSFLIAGAALLFSCNSMDGFQELPEPDKEAQGQPLQLRWKFCVYSDIMQCFPGDFDSCPGGGDPRDTCPYVSSSSQGGSSSGTQSSSSGFVNGTTRMHEGKEKGQFIDKRDGKIYVYVIIGDQTWMAENLNFETTTGSMCFLNKPENCDKYGRLYNWSTATAQNFCPEGWSLPSNEDWQKLVDYVADKDTNGYDAEYLKTTSGWESTDFNRNGKDTYGFSALPSGYGTGNYSLDDGIAAYWWSSTGTNLPTLARSRYIDSQYSKSFMGEDEKTRTYSVRCFK